MNAALENLCITVASEGRLHAGGAQEPQCTRQYMRIPSTAGAQDAERSRLCKGSLDTVLKHPGIWRRSAGTAHHVRAIPTGLAGLDAQLPGGGWPCGALSEILFAYDGLGELALLMPALAELTRKGQRVVLVAPPYIPYAPALAAHGLDLRYVVQIDADANDGAWSAEQCLRSGSCGAVLSWMQHADYTQLRRLQLAAESGDALAFLFRPAQSATKASPAALRLQLREHGGEVDVEILKCRAQLERLHPTRLRCA